METLPKALSVPLDCIFEREGKSIVYVKQGEAYLPREVELGERNEVAVVIRKGLSARRGSGPSDPPAS